MNAPTFPSDGAATETAAPVEQMLAWLTVAEHEGWEAYYPLWTRLLASVRASAGLVWDGIWPSLHIGYPEDGDRAEGLQARFAIGDALFQHLREAGFRSKLMTALIGDRDGTRYGAYEHDVRDAVNAAVLDLLNTGGRILIDPQGKLTEGGGIPHDYGQIDEARDREIERAGKVYFTAACCPRAIPLIREWVLVAGERTPNDWIELASKHVEWWGVHARYASALEAEQKYDREVYSPAWEAADGDYNLVDDAIDHEADELQEARCIIEGLLFAIPSPDAAAFAIKVGIARRDGRDLNGFDDDLVAEADRFSSTPVEDPDLMRAWDGYRAGMHGLGEEYTNSQEDGELIVSIPARTMAGVEARLRAALHGHTSDEAFARAAVDGKRPSDRDMEMADFFDRLLWRAIEDVRQIGGLHHA